MKKTMTKAEAREFLKDKYVPVKGLEQCNQAGSIFVKAYPRFGEWPTSEEMIGPEVGYVRLWFDKKCFGVFCSAGDAVEELPLSDLLSIEIAEEPDPSELLKEAVSLLRELYGVVAGGLEEVKVSEEEGIDLDVTMHTVYNTEFTCLCGRIVRGQFEDDAIGYGRASDIEGEEMACVCGKEYKVYDHGQKVKLIK